MISRKLSREPESQSVHNELTSAIMCMGGEVEAVTRAAQQSNRDYKSVNYQLNSFTP